MCVVLLLDQPEWVQRPSQSLRGGASASGASADEFVPATGTLAVPVTTVTAAARAHRAQATTTTGTALPVPVPVPPPSPGSAAPTGTSALLVPVTAALPRVPPPTGTGTVTRTTVAQPERDYQARDAGPGSVCATGTGSLSDVETPGGVARGASGGKPIAPGSAASTLGQANTVFSDIYLKSGWGRGLDGQPLGGGSGLGRYAASDDQSASPSATAVALLLLFGAQAPGRPGARAGAFTTPSGSESFLLRLIPGPLSIFALALFAVSSTTQRPPVC